MSDASKFAVKTWNPNLVTLPRSDRLIENVTTLADRIIEKVDALTGAKAEPFHFPIPNPPVVAMKRYSAPPAPVAGLESVSRATAISEVSTSGATVVILNVISPFVSFDVTTWVMSGAPPLASPVGSVLVVSATLAPAATRHAAAATIPTARMRSFRPPRIAGPLPL